MVQKLGLSGKIGSNVDSNPEVEKEKQDFYS